MSSHGLSELLAKYRDKGVLVDANLLLLYFVGTFEPEQIPKYKRTRVYTIDDFGLLAGFLRRFRSLVTTPNVLTEVSNLSTQLPERVRRVYFREFRNQVQVLDEQYLPSGKVCRVDYFERVGLTDATIAELSRGQYLVLTDDLRLATLLHSLGIDVINFNHLRFWRWSAM